MNDDMNFDISLGDFVALYPKSRKVFDKFDLDYCCGGKDTIKNASAIKNIDFENLTNQLKSAMSESSDDVDEKILVDVSLTDVVNHILSNHHDFLWKELPYVEKLLDKVSVVHAEHHGEFLVPLNSVFKNLKESLEKHLRDEETTLFPFIKEVESLKNEENVYFDAKKIKEIIEKLEQEHDEAGDALSEMRKLTSNYTLPSDACASFSSLYEHLLAIEDNLHQHVHLENSVLFPRAIDLINLSK